MTKRRLTRRQRQVRRNRIILACAAAALLIIIIVIISVSMKGCSKSKNADKNVKSTTAKVEESTQTKENESTSEEVSSTDTSSSIMSDATSVSASSDSSEFAPPVVPSGNTVSKGTTSKGFQIQEINGATYIDGVLIANKTYALPQDFIPTNPDQPVNADRSSTCLDKTLMSAWNTMLKDATAKGLNIYIASGYRSYNYQVNVYVEFTVHGVDGAGQGHDLKAAAEGVGVVFLLRYIIYAHREAVGGAQRLHSGKADVFLQGKLFDLFKGKLLVLLYLGHRVFLFQFLPKLWSDLLQVGLPVARLNKELNG